MAAAWALRPGTDRMLLMPSTRLATPSGAATPGKAWALPPDAVLADLGAPTLRRLHGLQLPWLPKPAPVARLAQRLRAVEPLAR